MIWRIARGGGGMPSFANVLTPKQLNELVTYLETLKAPGEPAPESSGGSRSDSVNTTLTESQPGPAVPAHTPAERWLPTST